MSENTKSKSSTFTSVNGAGLLVPALFTRMSNGSSTPMVAFTASCLGLLIFLWISFGGTLPFNAEGYRFSVEFNQATELASNAQVEIAGVVTGKLDGNQVAVDITARSGDAKVLTRAHAVVRLPAVLAQGDETLIPLEPP